MSNFNSHPLVSAGAVSPRLRLIEIMDLRFLSQAIGIANKRKIASIITTNNTVHISDLAKQLDCHEINLYRMMSFLAAYGIFEEKEDRYFIGNEMSDMMREDAPGNCHNYLLFHCDDACWEATSKMKLALDKTSNITPFQHVTGEQIYPYLASHPEAGRNFNLGIGSSTSAWQNNIPSLYDFSRYGSIVDLAGGCGALIKAILTTCPNVHATLFEHPSLFKDILPELTTDSNISTRFQTKAGDFLATVDCIADLFTVAVTLHCFDDGQLALILRNISEAMRKKPGCRLLIIEVDYEKAIVPNRPSGARQLDMRMMLFMGGRERDLNSWKHMLDQQGFKVLQKIPIPPSFMALECELA